ncbi:MAG: hypothetical protein SXA11_14555 [Cyanobacteriota bacterium]|nr:hypothetical protein [Cyanobacteriota bacterium]
MSRFFYEKSVSYKGHLIIPFVLTAIGSQSIYSYKLLSELGHKGDFHKVENPTGLFANSFEKIVNIAKEHLDKYSDVASRGDYFKWRYTYSQDLIIIYREADKYFYDHYKANRLENVAAPKIFESEYDCINWVKSGLDRQRATS